MASSSSASSDNTRKRRAQSPPPVAANVKRVQKADTDIIAVDDVPSDVEAALQLLRQQFPIDKNHSRVPPIILQHQLKSIVPDCDIDLWVAKLTRANKVRKFKLVASNASELKANTPDVGLVFTADYVATIRRIQSSAITPMKQVLDSIINELLPNTPTCVVDKEHFLEVVAPDCVVDPKALRDRHATRSKDTKQFGLDDIIPYLVRVGLLVPHTSNSVLLTIPSIGAFMSNLEKGRREVAAIIRRQGYKEILIKDLLKRKLKRTKLDTRFHVRDMTGNGMLALTPTTLGDLARLAS